MTITIYVPATPEFKALVDAAKKVEGSVVRPPVDGYWKVEAERELRFSRKSLELGPAIWNCALSGGFRGRIVEYGRDLLHLQSEA